MELRESAKAGLPRAGVRGTIGLLRRNHEFTKLYVAQLVSFAGDWFLTVALFGLVLELTHSAFMASLVVVAQMVPFFLLSPLGGVLADRRDRRQLMVTADVARAALCLAFLLVDDRSDIWLIYALLGGVSSFQALFDPAGSAAVPNLVDPEDLGAANVLVGSAWGAMLAVGAALGGLVAGAFGRDTAFIVDAASFAASGALLLGIRRPFSERRDGEHPGTREAVLETVRYASRDHRVLALLAVKGGFGLGAGGAIVLLPVFAAEVFRAGDVGIGVLLAARGVGALIGPFIARALIRDDDGRLFSGIGVALGTFGVFYGGFPLVGSLWVAAPLATGAHLGGGAQWTMSTYGLQKLVPDALRGRVFAFDFMLVTLSITASSLLAGYAATRMDPRIVMGILAGVSFAYALTWRALTAGLRVRTQAAPAA